MATNKTSGAGDDPEQKTEPLAAEVARLSGAIQACDRLGLLSARSVVRCAIPTHEREEAPNGKLSRAFIPSVSRNQQNDRDAGEAASGYRHPTTSAQCIAALQAVLPVVGRFRLGTHESKDLAFHPIERGSLKEFEPDRLSVAIRETIDCGLEGLLEETSDGASAMLDGISSDGLTSGTFGFLHPFTAAQVLRAIAPSKGMYRTVWWRSLFVILWFLNRRTAALGGNPSIDATGSPGTAFLTSKCVDALETVLNVFERRRARFRRLIDLMDQLYDVHEQRRHLGTLAKSKLISEDIFGPGYDLRKRNLGEEIRACVRELALDSALPRTYRSWVTLLQQGYERSNDDGQQNPLLAHVIDSFAAAMKEKDAIDELGQVRKLAKDNLKTAAKILEALDSIQQVVARALDPTAATDRTGASVDLRALPTWLCSADYRTSTRNLINSQAAPDAKNKTYPKPVLETLESHWRRHRDACANATNTLRAFDGYLGQILDTFERLAKPDSGTQPPGTSKAIRFLREFTSATGTLDRLRHQLSFDVATGARWADVLMNRHLAYASSGATSLLDPGELAHAVRIVCGSGGRVRFDTVLQALHVVSDAQRPDGTWICQQPFYWTATGFSASTISVEIAWAMVSTMNVVLRSPDRFGASLEAVTEGFQPIFAALDRFFEWLSSSIQSFPVPPALNPRRSEPHLYGWCSDRLYEPGRIHSWATAAAIEFLVEFRQLLQERINSLLRAEFLSHHPTELKPLAEVEPTDLGNRKNDPVVSRLALLLREHETLQLAEGPWMQAAPPKTEISFWSGILYGPPGTSKTFLAKATAGELDWPLISLSPSDFLARGEQHIESRAQEIFSSLSAGSRLVYFFDEIDELIRDRRQMDAAERSVFSFLTPSFLTKLQDFRDQAKTKEFMFLIGTNYFERIDSAARRTGRIDQTFPIVYPDLESRAYMILQFLMKRLDPRKDEKIYRTFNFLRKLSGASSDVQVADVRLAHRLEALQGYLTVMHKWWCRL
jgi:hypothetical protein